MRPRLIKPIVTVVKESVVDECEEKMKDAIKEKTMIDLIFDDKKSLTFKGGVYNW